MGAGAGQPGQPAKEEAGQECSIHLTFGANAWRDPEIEPDTTPDEVPKMLWDHGGWGGRLHASAENTDTTDCFGFSQQANNPKVYYPPIPHSFDHLSASQRPAVEAKLKEVLQAQASKVIAKAPPLIAEARKDEGLK